MPQDFIQYTKELFGPELWQKFLSAFNEPTPVSIRLNKGTDISDLQHLPITEQIPWSRRGYYLAERPQFTLDPLLHAGAYYVQEASSQYLDFVLEQVIDNNKFEEETDNPEIKLAIDFCAAPGGKSLILRDHLPEDALLIANEYVRKRAWILAENIEKAGAKRVMVTNNSTDDIVESGIVADLILCDVPCSGEGMFRKNHAAMDEWSVANVQKCAALQREIVTNAWRCLRNGGILIYSTCTFNLLEDENNADFIQKELGGEVIVPARKFIPGQDRGEGQFMIAFRKPDNCDIHRAKPLKKNKLDKTLQRLNKIEGMKGVKGDDSLPQCELSLDNALKYLRGEALILPPETPRGLVAISYHGFRLGTMKNIGSRANNLYPAEWRIKHV